MIAASKVPDWVDFFSEEKADVLPQIDRLLSSQRF